MGDLINLPVLISSLLGFLILFFVLRKFLFPPVLKMIDEGRESIEAAFQEVDNARAEVARLKTEYEGNLARISAEAQAKLQEAMAQAERWRRMKAKPNSSAKLLARTGRHRARAR